MLKALIVEDEYLAREELAYLIREHSRIDIVASVEDGLEAFKFLQGTRSGRGVPGHQHPIH